MPHSTHSGVAPSSQVMHHGGKIGSNNASSYSQQNAAISNSLSGQQRLKKNSAIDRSSSQATGMTSGKLGQSKTSAKMHANESSMHSGSSKLIQPGRDMSQKYMADKQQQSQSNQ